MGLCFNDDEIKKYIVNIYYPEDIFSADELETWALENGFIKEEDDESS